MQVPINAEQTKSANVRFLWPTGGRHSDFVYTMKVLIFSSSEIVKTGSELIRTSSELISTRSELISRRSELISRIAALISRIAALMAANHAEVFSNGRILALVPRTKQADGVKM